MASSSSPKLGRPSLRKRTDFGQRIRDLREGLGLSQKEVAHKMGVTQASYAAWERDPVAFRPDQLALLASTLQVSIDQLVTGSEPPKKRGHGPVGKARRVFEELSQLPRHQQQDIITFVEAMLRARRARNQANSTTD